MEKRGFTVVEVLITLVVMSILLTLGVVGLRNTQAQARDSERKADAEAIARGIEQRYSMGNARDSLPTASAYPQFWPNVPSGKGYYPGINESYHSQGVDRSEFSPTQITGGYITENLPGTSKAILTSPSGKDFSYICVYACQPAENQSQINAAFNGSGGKDQYLYEPVDGSGSVCSNGDCRRFNLYWYSEVEQQIKKIKSKQQ